MHSLLYSGGTFTSFDFPLSTYTNALGLNDSGAIVGWFTDARNEQHGFMYANGTFSQVDVPGAASTSLVRIKNHGNIVGIYTPRT
jgi:probable HAF family extracellular repeat protein